TAWNSVLSRDKTNNSYRRLSAADCFFLTFGGRGLLDQLLFAEPIEEDVAEEAGVVGELEAGGAQVFRGGLIGGGEIADRQGVVAAGFDLAAAEHHGGKIAALELTDDHAVVEWHDVPDVAHQQLSLGDDVAHAAGVHEGEIGAGLGAHGLFDES